MEGVIFFFVIISVNWLAEIITQQQKEEKNLTIVGLFTFDKDFGVGTKV